MLWANGFALTDHMDIEEAKIAFKFLEIYQIYTRCRELKLVLQARDFDMKTLDIIYTFDEKVREAAKAKAKSKGAQ